MQKRVYRKSGCDKNLVAHFIVMIALFIVTSVTGTLAVAVTDRTHVLVKQISLLKNRHNQAERELAELQTQRELHVSEEAILHASKSLLDKAALDIAVAKSDLDSITIELTDSEQSVTWLQKNVQELENQLNIMSVFQGNQTESSASSAMLYTNLQYQKKLFSLEKERVHELRSLKILVNTILQYRKEMLEQLKNILSTKRLMQIKEQQTNDELRFQEIQNGWLQKVKQLYTRLNQLDPSKSRQQYIAIEREVYLANEHASVAYSRALIARYKDQIQNMHLLITRNTSISLLSDMHEQVQLVGKQVDRLQKVIASRRDVLLIREKNLSTRHKDDAALKPYLAKLVTMSNEYQTSQELLTQVHADLLSLRKSLDHALQVELSARQGLPKVTWGMLLELSKEFLLLPMVTFQVLKNFSASVQQSIAYSTVFELITILIAEISILTSIFLMRQRLSMHLALTQQSRLDVKRLNLYWVHQHFYEISLILNFIGMMYYWHVPFQSYLFLLSLIGVFVIFKGILTFLRLSLLENTADLTGEDVKWYKRLRVTLMIGGFITGMTIFLHQLPLIYELKLLFDCAFLLFLLVLSIILLRSSRFLLAFFLQRFVSPHPHIEKITRFLSVLVPTIILLNAIVGLMGYAHLVFNLAWYQGIFISVLATYLVLRGLLTDLFEEMSRLVIFYLRNGWFWTEAFLKPLHRILRILLFLMAWSVLFLLYGWDKESPIVEQLNHFLHYEFLHVLKTSITPLNSIETLVVVAIFYWTAKWSREFVYRILSTRTQDSGIRNSFAILTQYCVVLLGLFISLRILGVDLNALAIVASMFAFGVGFGLRDLANNFVSGFLILLERPLRVGDIVSINGVDGEVMYIGSRAVTVRTWDHLELVVPNTEIFNKSFINWTSKDNIVRTVVPVKVSRHDNPHQVKTIIYDVLVAHKEVLKEPVPEVYLKEMSDTLMEFELRYHVNIRQVKSCINVKSAILMGVWDAFSHHGIKAPFPQHEVFLKSRTPALDLS